MLPRGIRAGYRPLLACLPGLPYLATSRGIGYHAHMSQRYPGLETYGAVYRCRVPLPPVEAQAVSEDAEARAISPADVIRGIVRQWRKDREARAGRATPGGSSTTPGG